MVVYEQRSPDISAAGTSSAERPIYCIEKTKPFVTERDLVEKFTDSAIDNDSINGYFCELDAGNGVADIVVYKLRRDWENYSSLISIKPQWAYALKALPYRKTFDLDMLRKLTGLSKKTALKVLNEYINAGFCRKNSLGWIKEKQPRPPVVQMHAIEAKLRDWRKALYQASRYLDFAHQSWVLLDNKYCHLALENSREFTRRSIGLLTVSPNGDFKVLINAKTSAPRSQISYWNANVTLMRNISTLDNFSYTS